MDSPERNISPLKGKLFVFLIWSTAWVVLLIPRSSSAQSPPRLSSNAQEIRRVVPSGTVIQLPCPVEASDPSSLLFEWYKDRRPISTFAEVRFRVGNSGTLKIKGVLPEDMGHYVCRAVNGYGSVEVNATLIVLDDDYDESSDSDHQGSHGDNVLPETETVESKGNGVKATLIHVTKFNQPIVHKPVGSSVRLKCVATGNPRPQIIWLRNGHPFSTSGEASAPTKRGRWTLNLQNLQVSDSGNYTCIVRNALGVDNASFVIDVVDRIRSKPEITGTHPVNTTVEIGSDAVFQCRVKSDDPPHIQWLKHVESSEFAKEDLRQKVIKLQGEFYRILKNTEVMERPDGTFLNKLLIPDAKESDTGKYVCLSVNTIGYIHRSAFLTVLPRIRAPSIPEEASSFPLFIVIAVITTTAVLLASAMALVLHCRFKKTSPPPTMHRSHHLSSSGSSSQRHHHSKTSSSSVGTMETNHVYMPAPSVPEIMVDKMVETTRTYSPPQPHYQRHHPTPYGYYC